MSDLEPDEEPILHLTYEERLIIANRRRNRQKLAIAAAILAGFVYFLYALGLLPKISFGSEPETIPFDDTPPPDFTPSPALVVEAENLETLHREIARQAALLRNSYDSGTDKAALTAVEFLTANTLDERLSWVRQPDRVAPLMREYYSRAEVTHPEFKTVLGRANLTVGGREVVTVSFQSMRNDNLAIALLRDEGDDRFLVDWESFVCYSEMPASEFLEKKPTTPTTFRLYAELSDYYNYGYSDSSKYQSLVLKDRDDTFALYGYAPRDAPWLKTAFPTAKPSSDPKPLTLKISFPADVAADNIVTIDEFVTLWWFAPSP